MASIAATCRGGAICDVGGGANPQLDPVARRESRYVLLDIDPGELAKAPDDVERVTGDIASPGFEAFAQFDLVLSRTVAEHVADPRAFHHNVHSLLAPGGVAVHFFPTLWALPFVANRIFPEALAERLLLKLQPERVSHGTAGKFPALYHWCRGPSPQQLRRLTSVGFTVKRYVGFFGHDYYRRVPWAGPTLNRWEDHKARVLTRHPHPALTSYGLVVLQRPPAG